MIDMFSPLSELCSITVTFDVVYVALISFASVGYTFLVASL